VPERAVARLEGIAGWTGDVAQDRDDVLAVEEPLEIRFAGCNVAVTMRTPGHDFELAAGFLFTEGIIRGPGDIASMRHCPADDEISGENIVNVNPADQRLVDPSRWQRNFFATSSCGVCGKASIDAVCRESRPIEDGCSLPAEMLYGMQRKLREAQPAFARTGGLHAAGLFDLNGRLLVLREDVGRHNAVDKVIGHALLSGMLPLRGSALMVSGRSSFEVTQKALAAGIPILAAVSAPSSLAVDLARSSGMTLVGFLREGRFNVYAGAGRITG
jgi:FdhD protein